MGGMSTGASSSSSLHDKDVEKQIESIYATDMLSAPIDENDRLSAYDEGIIRVTSTRDEPSKNEELSVTRTLSRARSTRTQKDLDAVIGTQYHVRWEKGDMENPFNWSSAKRGYLLFLVSMQTLIVVLYSTAYISGLPGLMKDFGITSQNVGILGMTIYLFGIAVGPLFLAPLSELYGRRPVYLVSLSTFVIFVIPACVAKNFATILIVRFLGAFAGSVTISNAPGTIGDIYNEDSRAMAFSWFALFPMNGPVLGPIIGGFMFGSVGWRWINWLVLILAFVFLVLAFTHPETYTPVLLRKRAERLRRETGDERYMSHFCYRDGEGDPVELLKVNLKRPLLMLTTEPICFFWALYVALVYGILYLCFTAYPIVFSEHRGWGAATTGLSFCGIGIGICLAVACEPLSRAAFNRHPVDPETGKPPPEARVLPICVASIMIPVSIFWFAWTCVPASIHWAIPISSGVVYGLGSVLVFLHANNYLVTCYDVFSASAMSGNALTRSILGGVMPLFGPLMYHNLGPNIAATVVGVIAAALVPIPFAFYFWGAKIRARSRMLIRLQREKEERDRP